MQTPLKQAESLLAEIERVKSKSRTAGPVVHSFAKMNFKDFVSNVTGVPILGYNDKVIPPHPSWAPFGELHRKMMDKLESPQKQLLFLVARQHAKTTLVSELYPAWEIIRNPSIRIMVISHGKGVPVSAINQTAGYLQDLGVRFQKNDEEEKIVIRPRHGLRTRDPTLMAYSYESKFQGRHADIIILDDTVVLDNSYTPYQRDKYEEWFNAEVGPVLESTGRLIVTGVRWRHADYHGVLADPVKHPEFGPPENPGLGRVISPACDAEFNNVIWKEKWSEALLRDAQKKYGPLYFRSQFLLDPSGMEGGQFKLEWIFGADEEGKRKEYKELPDLEYRVLGVDPALGVGQNRFAMCVGGVGVDQKFYVMAFARLDIPTGLQPKTVLDTYYEYKCNRLGIEKIGYQRALMNEITSKDPAIPVEGYESNTKKEIRLSELQVPLFNGMIKFPLESKPWKTQFIEEYVTFPSGEQDDMMDALYYAFKVAKMYDLTGMWNKYEPAIVAGRLPHYRPNYSDLYAKKRT